jgi:hypothetical protein
MATLLCPQPHLGQLGLPLTAAFTGARDISRLTSLDTTFRAKVAVTNNISQQMVSIESLVATNQQQA